MSLRALVVDDSKTARIALKRSLGNLGLTIDFAESGEGAVEFLQQAQPRPHVVFMDMMMPGIGGLKATQIITNDADMQGIRVIMCSSNESDADRKAASEHGAIALISKPPVKQQLEDVLNEIKADVDKDEAYEPESTATFTLPALVDEPATRAPQTILASEPMTVLATEEPTRIVEQPELTPQIEQMVRRLTEQMVKELAKNTANDVARNTAMNVASNTAKEITNTTAKKMLPDVIESMVKEVLQSHMKGLPNQVFKWVDQRMQGQQSNDASAAPSAESKAALLESLKPGIHAIIDEAGAVAEDNAYEAASEAVKKGVAPLKWGFIFLTLILISSITVQFL